MNAKEGYEFTVLMHNETTGEFEEVDRYSLPQDSPRENYERVGYTNNWIVICHCLVDGAKFVHASIANVPTGALRRAMGV